jgi:diadenosine tetraphosphatase ApaH/serine/threonine PP2A family protein phosphatase
MFRENPESEEIYSTHGSLTEIVDIYGNDALFHAINVFAVLPIAARVNGDSACVDGGSTPDLRTLKHICGITRPLGLTENPMADALLWSDPMAAGRSKRRLSYRGCDFGEDVFTTFLVMNGLRLLV